MNLVESDLEAVGDGFAISLGRSRVRIDVEEAAAAPRLREFAGGRVVVGIRPERLEDAALDPEIPDDRRIHGVVRIREALGSDVLLHFVVEGVKTRLAPEVHQFAHDVEDPTQVEELESQEGVVFIGRFAPQSRAREDETVTVALKPRALQFFDPGTGWAIR